MGDHATVVRRTAHSPVWRQGAMGLTRCSRARDRSRADSNEVQMRHRACRV